MCVCYTYTVSGSFLSVCVCASVCACLSYLHSEWVVFERGGGGGELE